MTLQSRLIRFSPFVFIDRRSRAADSGALLRRGTGAHDLNPFENPLLAFGVFGSPKKGSRWQNTARHVNVAVNGVRHAGTYGTALRGYGITFWVSCLPVSPHWLASTVSHRADRVRLDEFHSEIDTPRYDDSGVVPEDNGLASAGVYGTVTNVDRLVNCLES